MFNKKTALYTLIIILVLSAPVISAEIYLYDNVEINNSKIMLGDIARIETESDILYEELIKIELGDSPRPGRNVEMSPELVSLYIRNNGFSRSDYEIFSEGNINISVSSQELSGDTLFNLVEKNIKDRIYNDFELQTIGQEDFKIEIEIISGPGDIVIPAGNINIDIPEDIIRPAGRLNIPVEIYIGDKYWNRVFMTLMINYQMEVYFLRNNIARNQKIDDEDLIIKEAEFDFHPAELVLNLDNEIVQHGVTKRNYQKDEILKLSMLEYPDIISFNQEVIAEFEQGAVFVTTKVKARDNGRIGEVIEVENIDTGRRLKAEVLSENRVRIIN